MEFREPNEPALHLHVDDLDEQQLTSWLEQAAAIPRVDAVAVDIGVTPKP